MIFSWPPSGRKLALFLDGNCGGEVMDRAKPEPDDIFCDALELTDSAERAAFLDRACVDDANLRCRVQRLLEAHAEADRFLAASPAIGTATTEAAGETSGAAQGLAVGVGHAAPTATVSAPTVEASAPAATSATGCAPATPRAWRRAA